MAKPSILSCGEVLWDLFPDGARFGGAPANFACHAALLGADVSLLSAVGKDDRGREAMSILQQFPIDTSLIQEVEGIPTGTVGIILDAAGKPSFEIHAASAWDQISWSDALQSRISAVDLLYFGTLGQRGELSRETIRRSLVQARERGITRILDVNLRKPFFDPALIRDSIALASVLKISDEELPVVAEACGVVLDGKPEWALRKLRVLYNLDCVAMTRGAEGAILVSIDEMIDQPGIPVVVQDTVGAGDAFTAALAIGLLRRQSLSAIAYKACKTASAVCGQQGAVTMPNPR